MELSSVSAIAGYASAMSSNKLESDVSVIMLKKSIDLQEQMATQLVQAIPNVTQTAPGDTGQTIDVTA